MACAETSWKEGANAYSTYQVKFLFTDDTPVPTSNNIRPSCKRIAPPLATSSRALMQIRRTDRRGSEAGIGWQHRHWSTGLYEPLRARPLNPAIRNATWFALTQPYVTERVAGHSFQGAALKVSDEWYSVDGAQILSLLCHLPSVYAAETKCLCFCLTKKGLRLHKTHSRALSQNRREQCLHRVEMLGQSGTRSRIGSLSNIPICKASSVHGSR